MDRWRLGERGRPVIRAHQEDGRSSQQQSARAATRIVCSARRSGRTRMPGRNKAAELTAEIDRAMLTVCDCPGFVTGFPPILIIPTEGQAYWYDIKSLKRFNAFVCTPYPVERRSPPMRLRVLEGRNALGSAAAAQA